MVAASSAALWPRPGAEHVTSTQLGHRRHGLGGGVHRQFAHRSLRQEEEQPSDGPRFVLEFRDKLIDRADFDAGLACLGLGRLDDLSRGVTSTP
jgi:hypothetical protein